MWKTKVGIAFFLAFSLLNSPVTAAKRSNQKAAGQTKLVRYLKSKHPRRYEGVALELAKAKLYFSALYYAKKHMLITQRYSDQFNKLLELLVAKTGIEAFFDFDINLLAKSRSPALFFIVGKRLFSAKVYADVPYFLKKIKPSHRLYPEARMILGTISNYVEKYSEAERQYAVCAKAARVFGNKASNEKLERYYSTILETCTINIARIAYKKREYEKSVRYYGRIPKTAFYWPYLLLEKAWANYYLKDYNRALGLLVTYKAPLLSSYFMPEAEILAALSYYRLCLWSDALKVVEQFYEVYRPRSNQLKNLLVKYKNSDSYFFKLMLTPLDKTEKANSFIRNLVTQVSKKTKFNLDLFAYNNGIKELQRLKKASESQFLKLLGKLVERELKRRQAVMNMFVKKKFFDFVNQIHQFSYEMFNIKLEIISDKRNLLYENKKLAFDRSRGSYENVNRRTDQYFWTYEGAFWADELGDYSFGLKSNCQKVERKDEEVNQ